MTLRNSHLARVGSTLLILLAATVAAHADTKNWIGETSTWDDVNAWSLAGVPQSADDVHVSTSGATVTYQNPSTPTGLVKSLFVEASVSGATLVMPGGQLTTAKTEVGFDLVGTFSQSGGTHTITGAGELDLGFNLNSRGTYNLSGNAALNINYAVYVGQNGVGIFNQTGGTFTLGGSGGDGFIIIAAGSAGSGTYNLSAGTVSAKALIINTGAGNGLFNQTGGTVTLSSSSGISIGSTGASGTMTYELSGTGNVTDANCLIGGTRPSVFKQSSGTHTVTQRLSIANGTAGSYTLSGGNLFTGETQVSRGKFDQTGGAQTVTGALIIGGSSGPANQAVFNLSAGKLSSASMRIDVTGNFTQIGGVTQTGAMTMVGNSTLNLSGGTLAVSGLTLEANKSKIDLTDRAILINYTGSTTLLPIRDFVSTGYSGGTWTGAGITSSTAAANPRGAVGYGEAKDVLGLSGSATAPWQGYTADATSILVRYTLAGDANLDGSVDFADLVRVAQRYGIISTAGATWAQGDFNYDGTVNFADLVKVAQNYGGAVPADVAGFGAGFEGDWARAVAAVPEPGVMGLLVLAGFGFIARHRRQCSTWNIAGG